MANKLSKKGKIVIISISVFLVLCIIGALISLNIFYGIFHKGNASKYNIKNTEVVANSTIEGNTYYFLGSSVTKGSASFGNSMADYIAKRNNCMVVKSAVSGTFLADAGKNSYISRLNEFDKNVKPDAFICQLSTNDTRHSNKGEVSASFNKVDFDVSTTYGAIEYIIAYAKETWDCEVVFYTNSFYVNDIYQQMVDTMIEIADKWDITLIDLYNDTQFNDITDNDRKLYMNDNVHPTRAGYKLWWTPKFEDVLGSL